MVKYGQPVCLTKRQYSFFNVYNMSLLYDENVRNILNHLQKQETREKSSSIEKFCFVSFF